MINWRAGVAALVLAVGCSPAGANRPAPQRKQRDVLTRAEIQASAQRDENLYQALRSLRPAFLEVAPGQVSFGATPVMYAVVYIDGMREPSLDGLRTIRASDVDEVRYLDPSRASTQYGPSAGGGAVVVTLHKGARVGQPEPDTSAAPGQ